MRLKKKKLIVFKWKGNGSHMVETWISGEWMLNHCIAARCVCFNTHQLHNNQKPWGYMSERYFQLIWNVKHLPCQEAAPSAQHCPCSQPLTFLTLPPNMGQWQEAGVGPWHCHPLSHMHLDEAPRSHWKQARGSTAKQRVSFRQMVRKGHALHNTWLLESAQ